MNNQPRIYWTLKARRYADIAIVIAFLIIGVLVGSRYYRDVYAAGGSKPWFYQVDFGPAVMWTCGHGFVLPDVAAAGGLGRFLRQEVDQFSCDELPSKPALRPIVGSQPWLTWSHLLRSAAVIWSFTGIGWSRLAPLAGIFFGTTVAMAYLLFRLVSGRVLATAGAAFVLTSPLFIVQIPQFRDFAKVPFMLGLGWLLAQLLQPSNSVRRLLAVSTAYGVALGVAIGFRNDALITIPPFVLLVMAGSSARLHAWRQRGAALLLAGVAFAVFSIPVLQAYTNGGGSASSHAAFLGLMRPVDSALGVSNGQLYEIGYGIEDSYAAAVISGYASRAGGAQSIAGHSPEYDAAATDYYLALLRTLPADTLTRVYASIDRVVALPSSVAETQSISYIESLRPFYAARSRVLVALWWIWLPAVLIAILLVSLRNLRLAILLGLLLGYFCGYPAIQFNDRHILHLSLIPIAAVAFVLQNVFNRQWGREWRNAFILAAIVIAVVIVPLLLLRGVQDNSVRSLIRSYLSAPAEPVELTERAVSNGNLALDFNFGLKRGLSRDGIVTTDYLIAEFDASGCNLAAVDVTVRYEASHAFADFTRRLTVSLPRANGTARVALATYSYSMPASSAGEAIWYRPKGYELPATQRACLTRVSRILQPSQFPVLLNTTLPPDWERLPLYFTLSRWERRHVSATPSVYVSPPDLDLPKTFGIGEVLHVADLVERASNATLPGDGRLVVDGAGAGAFTYIARFKERPLSRGRQLIVEGNLKQGGLSAGWLSNGAWASQIDITEPGPFVAAFEVPADGNYSFVIANNLKGSSLRNVCEFTKLAWLP